MQAVKLITNLGEMVIDNIDEYVCGFNYFYVRLIDGTTTSISRKSIHMGFRRLPNGKFSRIYLKKPPTEERVGKGENVYDTRSRDS